MLATLALEPFSKKGWFFEIKWDGYRAMAEVNGSKISLYSRHGLSFNEKFPSILKSLKKIKRECVLDGEIVVINKKGLPDFQLLQNRQLNKGELIYMVFDLLFLDGKDLRFLPLFERKKLLRALLPKNTNIRYSDHIEENGEMFYKKIGDMGMEGIMAKDSKSPYRAGIRSLDWLKIKKLKTHEAVIGGYTRPRGARKWFGALVLGVYQNNALKYIGHTGGGFDENLLEDLYLKLERLKTDTSPFQEKIKVNSPVTWVRPEMVCEVKFQEWTSDGILRQPIFLGLRQDALPREVTREDAIVFVEKSSTHKKIGELSLTNLDKIYFPADGYTKGDVINYYKAIAPIILPYLRDRPESLNRHPNGINEESFFQKNITVALPSFVETYIDRSESEKRDLRYILCQNKETILYMANLGCIELNPWNSRKEFPDHPDYMIFDLDPGETTFENLIKVAKVAHKVLDDVHAPNFIKTSGKRGFHICVPLDAQYGYDSVRQFAELVARIVHKKLPEITSVERNPLKRTKKIYVDFLQNRRAQTLAAPYCVRPVPGAVVSTPLRWEEIKPSLDPRKWTIKTILQRVEKKGDLWKPVIGKGVDLVKVLNYLHKME